MREQTRKYVRNNQIQHIRLLTNFIEIETE